MISDKVNNSHMSRRSLLKAAAAAGITQLAFPGIVQAQGEKTVKIGIDNSLTGIYAAFGKNELIGSQLAVDEINSSGGILGRKVELIVEDASSTNTGLAIQKANKLVNSENVDFLVGNENSAMVLGMAQVAKKKGILHIVPGAHSDEITGSACNWNVFRICSTTTMLINAVAKSLIDEYGKNFYFITADYVFGRSLLNSYDTALKQFGGKNVGVSLPPLGTTDFLSFLIKAAAAKPDVIVLLVGGDDMVNALKQFVQFGFDKRFHVAGAQQELELLEALPPEARIGSWVFEWYWRQKDVPGVDKFVAEIKKRAGGKVPTARHWFGYVAGWTCALAARQAKTLDGEKMARALQGMKLPPEVALMPNDPFYRAAQNQLIASLYVGTAQASGPGGEEDLFKISKVVDGASVNKPLAETGCRMEWPTKS
ncbi:Branched-chain amino acid transport system substrate-binding protein OS=Castellaniella defragrans OX=75697 GN=HNR28_002066 PE=3 SV=1 [Castellaniella defragrans]